MPKDLAKKLATEKSKSCKTSAKLNKKSMESASEECQEMRATLGNREGGRKRDRVVQMWSSLRLKC